MHDVARVHQSDARAAVDGRGDARIVELSARVVDHGLIDLQLGGELIDRCALRVDRLLARQILRLQYRVSLQIPFGVGQLGRILGLGGDGLGERGLIRAGVDLRKQVALVHGLALGESDLLQLAVHARAHRHRIESLNGAQPGEVNRYVGLRHGRGVDGNRRRLMARGGIHRLVNQRAPCK